jgi:hypothetical protein
MYTKCPNREGRKAETVKFLLIMDNAVGKTV